MRTHLSIFKIVACLMEFKQLRRDKANRYIGISVLAKRYETSERAIKRWAKMYERDMQLFGMSQTTLLHKLAMKQERIERLSQKYHRLRALTASSNSTSSENKFHLQLKLIEEELKMYRDLYNDTRERLDRSKRANHVNRTRLYQVKRELNDLKVHVRRTSPCIEDTSPGVYDDTHRSL